MLSCTEILQGNWMTLSAKGAAYQVRLSALQAQGQVVVAASPEEARERFENGEGHALAGIRESLEALEIPGTRVIGDNFALIEQAVAVPVSARTLIPLINRVLNEVN